MTDYINKKMLLIYNDGKSTFSKQQYWEEILKNMWSKQFLKEKNNLLELAKSFIELKNKLLKDREKNKTETEKLFLTLFFISFLMESEILKKMRGNFAQT